MLYESFDPLLEDGIAAICDSDWNAAQATLSRRLDESARLGRRRLNLFLLSVVAARVGLEDISSQLAESGRATPVEMGEPRYFGTSDDPVRRQLENDWWTFNGWQHSEQTAEPRGGGDSEISWAVVLDGALEGRAGELERRWSRFLDGDHPHRAILWNLIAIGYLESGDLRTYEEMKESAPSHGNPSVPESLAQLLSHAGLQAALADLAAGRWVTSETLTLPTAPPQSSDSSPVTAWEAGMEEAFSLLCVGRTVEAARKLGPLVEQGTSLHKAFALNALALALFGSGEYGAAEEALNDSRVELSRSQPEQEPELCARFGGWLQDAGSVPVSGQVLCDPFSSPPAGQPGAGGTGAEPDGFFSVFEQTLEALRQGDLAAARRHLRAILSEPSSKQPTQSFLVTLLFAGTALLEGDHMDAQEAIDEASRVLERGGMDAGVLVEAQGRLAAAGAMTLAGKMEPDSLSTLDPWRDFPADFAQESYSGF